MCKEPTQSKYIKVEESSIHGTGVFARINVPKGKKVIEYTGEKITKKDCILRSRHAAYTLNQQIKKILEG